MLEGISLQELAKRITEIESQKRDYVTSTENLWMNSTVEKDPGITLNIQGKGHHQLTDISHHQIADKLQIPNNYYQRMLSTAPDLLATNVNAWFRRQPEKRMIRTLVKDNESLVARAFLSDRFTTTRDNAIVASAVLPVLMEQKEKNNLQIKSCELTERRMYLQCVYPKFEMEVKVGDPIQAGIVISNSEIGLGAFSIELLLYRLVCKNGMIRPASIRKHHVGRRIDTDEDVTQDFYRRETIVADQKAFAMKISDTVRHSFDNEAFNGEVKRLQEASGQIFKARKAEGIVEEVKKRFMLTEDEGGGILDALAEGKDFSKYGLANAVTFQSHDAKDYDRSIEFERIGGKIIDLSASDWKAILN